jgi:multidrug efflux pump subunit AcrA (membrane-fusion protein)
MLSHCFLVFIPFYSHLLTSYSLLAAALNQALARVAALEAELKTTAEALKDANAAKVSADKATKAAETKAKRAEKVLTEAAQKQTKREQAVVDRLDAICTSVGNKYFVLSFCFTKITPVDMLLLVYLYFYDVAKKTRRSVETSAREGQRSSARRSGCFGVKLEACSRCPSANSPCSNSHICWIVSKEKGRASCRQSQETG